MASKPVLFAVDDDREVLRAVGGTGVGDTDRAATGTATAS